MGKSVFCAVLLYLVALYAATAAGPYAVRDIPADISAGADAVVRESAISFDYASPSSGVMRVVRVVTVMNERGAEEGNFSVVTSGRRVLKNFSGEVYDQNGDRLRKIKGGDLSFNGYSAHLADDSRYNYYELNMAKYPYTVRYEYEIGYRNGMFNFPVFAPVPGYKTGVEKASYTLTVPAGCRYMVKEGNGDFNKSETTGKNGSRITTWTVEGIPPWESFIFSPSYFDIFPYVAATPYEFEYDGHKGSMENWREYGKWQCSLLEGRDILPDALIKTVHELTDGLQTDREKVKALYDYLGRQTRYVSIQLGIGGWQPMKAEDVYRNKFGDCKALTNYLMAMLKQCGIDSYYTEIYSGSRKRIWSDHPNAFQTNHVILYVPLEDGDLWLECTNTELPFGYVHRNIAGHDALVCRDGTMDFVTLPDYADSLNTVFTTLDVNVSSDRTAKMKFYSVYSGNMYERMWGFEKLDALNRTNRASRLINLASADVSNIAFEEDKSAIPSYGISFEVGDRSFGRTAGNRILLPVDVLSPSSARLPRRRACDIHIPNGYISVDSINYRIPEGYRMESLPVARKVSNELGSYVSEYYHDEGLVTIVHRYYLRSGEYDLAQYGDLTALNEAAVEDKKQVVVISGEQ